jgi:hypothetical protein
MADSTTPSASSRKENIIAPYDACIEQARNTFGLYTEAYGKFVRSIIVMHAAEAAAEMVAAGEFDDVPFEQANLRSYAELRHDTELWDETLSEITMYMDWVLIELWKVEAAKMTPEELYIDIKNRIESVFLDPASVVRFKKAATEICKKRGILSPEALLHVSNVQAHEV